MPAAEGLQAGRRVHVGDRHHLRHVDHFGQLLPAVFDLLDGGHVGHRAARLQVGQDDRHALAAAALDLLGAIGEDVGRFGHEVYAAEGDRPAFFFGRGQGAELIAVAAEVGQGDHFVLLVMMPQDQEPPAHGGADLLDPLREQIAGQFLVRLQLVGRPGGIEECGHGDFSSKMAGTSGMVQTEVTMQRWREYLQGTGSAPSPLAPERRGGRSLQIRRNVTLTIGKLNHAEHHIYFSRLEAEI